MQKINQLPFKKERLMFLEAIKTFSYIIGISNPYELSGPKLSNRLLEEEKKLCDNIGKVDMDRFFAYDSFMSALVNIFRNDQRSCKEINLNSETELVIEHALEKMKDFPETRNILNKYLYSELPKSFTPIDNEDSNLLEKLSLQVYDKYVENGGVLVSGSFQQILRQEVKGINTSYRVAIPYSIAMLLNAAVHSTIDNKTNELAMQEACETIEFMKNTLKFNQDHEYILKTVGRRGRLTQIVSQKIHTIFQNR